MWIIKIFTIKNLYCFYSKLKIYHYPLVMLNLNLNYIAKSSIINTVEQIKCLMQEGGIFTVT